MRKVSYVNNETGEQTFNYNIAKEWDSYEVVLTDVTLIKNEKLEKAKEEHRKKVDEIAGVG